MHISNLEIKGLYGYLDKILEFNTDLTLLVGINGSGKTSILNIINWILRPSIPNLCVTEFKSIQLSFTFKEQHYKIVCKHNRNSLTYKIQSEAETFDPLSVRIITPPCDIKNDEVLKSNLIQQYMALRPDNKEEKTWKLIETFPNPTIIGLDRNLYAEESERFYIEEGVRGRIKRGIIQNISPLERVKELVNREYRKRKNSILNLTSNLKNHLILSTFAGSITLESFNLGIGKKLNINQIEDAEKRVKEYFKNFEKRTLNSEEHKTIENYFQQLKSITREYQAKPKDEKVQLLFGLNASQFIKVERLLTEFEKFESESKKALEQIDTYITTLNFFFKDSSKRILFNEDTTELSFHSLDKEGNIIAEYRDIKFLSSGEKQILILFSYIAFNSKDGRIFLIDEPELSLHIKWQEDFLMQLEKITTYGTQLILATHSPILANKKRDKVKVLLSFNN